MSSLESSIHAELTSDATLAELVGTRVFGGRAPAQTAAPYLVYQVIASAPVEAHGETPDAKFATVQIAAYGGTHEDGGYEKAITVHNRALALLLRAFGDDATVTDQDRDSYEEPVKLLRRDFDLAVFAPQNLAL